MIVIYEKFWQLKHKKVVAKGQNLKVACLVWEGRRTNNDDLWEAFEKSPFFTRPFDFDSDKDTSYEDFIDSLSGEEMFEIMRDGKYNWYEEE